MNGEVRQRVFQPGDIVDGYVLHDGDCPFSNAATVAMNYDDGRPDSASLCGFSDGERICCAPAAYTAWVDGAPIADRFAETGNPLALCLGHAEVARGWAGLMRMHNVRPAGTDAEWAWRLTDL